jgi:N6-adenosine-specific RNA methylase IME4
VTGKYACIVADPPWEVSRRMGAGGRRARDTAVPYAFMSVDDIRAVDVPAAEDAHLYLWCTRRVFREGIGASVARAWGFEPCGEIIWGLRNAGMGADFFSNDHEPILIARRGNLPFSSKLGGVKFWKQLYGPTESGHWGKVHSAKPEAFMDLVEQSSPGPRLEMFSRRARLGWDTWGDESLHGT